MHSHCSRFMALAGRRVKRRSNDRQALSQETCLVTNSHYNRAG